MSEVVSPRGYQVQAPLGGDPAAGWWRARSDATGEIVALQRLPAGLSPELAQRVRSHAARLMSLAAPYLVRLREVVEDDAGLVLVHDLPTGSTLTALLADPRPRPPGEVVTVGVPVAQALAALHAQGIVHAHLTADCVRFTAHGMPLLSGLILSSLDPQPPVDPVADVRALGLLCSQLLAGAPDAPPALAAAIASAVDPAARVGAADFARALRAACPAAPVTRPSDRSWSGHHDLAADRSVRRRRPSRRVLTGVAAALLLVLAAGLGWASGRGVADGSTRVPDLPRPAAARAAEEPDWRGILDRLDAGRAAAYAAADPAALDQVYAAGAAPLRQDRATVGRLALQGSRAQGVRHAIRSIRLVQRANGQVRLRVGDVLSPYAVLDRSGRAISRSAGRPLRWYDVDLVRTPAGWRLRTVAPA